MLFPNSCRCSVGGEAIRLRSRSSRVRYPYSAPLFFFLFFSPWEVVSSVVYVCSFFFVCNTPPTCDHHLQLGLCWAIAMHKPHGQTLDKAVIDLARPFARIGPRSSRYVDAFILAVSGDLARSRQRSSKFANFQSPTQSSPQPSSQHYRTASRRHRD